MRFGHSERDKHEPSDGRSSDDAIAPTVNFPTRACDSRCPAMEWRLFCLSNLAKRSVKAYPPRIKINTLPITRLFDASSPYISPVPS